MVLIVLFQLFRIKVDMQMCFDSLLGFKHLREITVKEIDLNKLPLNELVELQKMLPSLIKKAKKNEKTLLREKMVALATESGFTLSEVLGTKTKPKKKDGQIGFVKAKYTNPNNTEQTWTGHGRKPKWAETHLKTGGTLKDLLINPK